MHNCFQEAESQAKFPSPLASHKQTVIHTRGYVTRTIYNSRLCLEATGLSRLNSCADKERPASINVKMKPKCLGGLGFVIGRVWDFLDRLTPSKYIAFYSAYT